MRKSIAIIILTCFIANTCVPPAHAQALLDLPAPGTSVSLSAPFEPVLIKGINVALDDAMKLDFIVDPGQSGLSKDTVSTEAERLIKYFMAALTVPEDDLWVNLSPYEDDRIIPEVLGLTEMGRDMLAQDYLLKQLTSSLIDPQQDLGREFWSRVYSKAQEQYGTTDIPVDTFNKVWIMPGRARVYEDKGRALIVESRLKVMLEADYLAMENNGTPAAGDGAAGPMSAEVRDILREVVIPALEQEVNTGRHFMALRQIYHSLILAHWFRNALRQAVLNRVYADRARIKGIDLGDEAAARRIYDQYVASFKKGVYDYVKEELDPFTQEMIPRKYFSGGETFNRAALDAAMVTTADRAEADRFSRDIDDRALVVTTSFRDVARTTPAVVRNRLMDPVQAAYFMAYAQRTNPRHEPLRVMNGASGPSIMDTLLAFDATDVINVVNQDYDIGLLRFSVEEWGQIMDRIVLRPVKEAVKFRRENHYWWAPHVTRWWSPWIIVEELKRGGVLEKSIEVDPAPDGFELKFRWTYPGQKPKDRRVRFIIADLTDPAKYPQSLRDILARPGAIDYYFQKAAMDVLNKKDDYLPQIARAVRRGVLISPFITEDPGIIRSINLAPAFAGANGFSTESYQDVNTALRANFPAEEYKQYNWYLELWEKGVGAGSARAYTPANNRPVITHIPVEQWQRFGDGKESFQVVDGRVSDEFPWVFTASSYREVNIDFRITSAITHLYEEGRGRSAADPIVVLDWGCGEGTALTGLLDIVDILKRKGYPDLHIRPIGYSRDFYPSWGEVPASVDMIVDEAKYLAEDLEYLGVKHLDLVFSRLGFTHFLHENRNVALGHLEGLGRMLRPGGEIRVDVQEKISAGEYAAMGLASAGKMAVEGRLVVDRMVPVDRIVPVHQTAPVDAELTQDKAEELSVKPEDVVVDLKNKTLVVEGREAVLIGESMNLIFRDGNVVYRVMKRLPREDEDYRFDIAGEIEKGMRIAAEKGYGPKVLGTGYTGGDEDKGRFYIAVEFLPGKDLREDLTFPRDRFKAFIRAMINDGIFIYDFSPEQFIYNKETGEFKLADSEKTRFIITDYGFVDTVYKSMFDYLQPQRKWDAIGLPGLCDEVLAQMEELFQRSREGRSGWRGSRDNAEKASRLALSVGPEGHEALGRKLKGMIRKAGYEGPEQMVARAIAANRVLGMGGDTVLAVAGIADICLKAERGIRGPVFVPDGQGLQVVDNIMPGYNVGQPIARIGNVMVLLMQDGKPAGVPMEVESAYGYNIARIKDYHLNYLKAIADFPQASYDRFIAIYREIKTRGHMVDMGTGQNLMVDAGGKQINFIDITDGLSPGEPAGEMAGLLLMLIDANFLAGAYELEDLSGRGKNALLRKAVVRITRKLVRAFQPAKGVLEGFPAAWNAGFPEASIYDREGPTPFEVFFGSLDHIRPKGKTDEAQRTVDLDDFQVPDGDIQRNAGQSTIYFSDDGKVLKVFNARMPVFGTDRYMEVTDDDVAAIADVISRLGGMLPAGEVRVEAPELVRIKGGPLALLSRRIIGQEPSLEYVSSEADIGEYTHIMLMIRGFMDQVRHLTGGLEDDRHDGANFLKAADGLYNIDPINMNSLIERRRFMGIRAAVNAARGIQEQLSVFRDPGPVLLQDVDELEAALNRDPLLGRQMADALKDIYIFETGDEKVREKAFDALKASFLKGNVEAQRVIATLVPVADEEITDGYDMHLAFGVLELATAARDEGAFRVVRERLDLIGSFSSSVMARRDRRLQEMIRNTLRQSAGAVPGARALLDAAPDRAEAFSPEEQALRDKINAMISAHSFSFRDRSDWFMPYAPLGDEALKAVIDESFTHRIGQVVQGNFGLSPEQKRALQQGAEILARNDAKTVTVTTYGGGSSLAKVSSVAPDREERQTEFVGALEAVREAYDKEGKQADITLVVYDSDRTLLSSYPAQFERMIRNFKKKYPRWQERNIGYRVHYGNIYQVSKEGSRPWEAMATPSNMTFMRHTWVGDPMSSRTMEMKLSYQDIDGWAKLLKSKISQGAMVFTESIDGKEFYKIEKPVWPDAARPSVEGGIDFKAKNLHLETAGQGAGLAVPDNMTDADLQDIEGLVPVIMNVTPVQNMSSYLFPSS